MGDEYAENYPQIALVLSRFYGLGSEFTLGGIKDFITKLLIDIEIQAYCSSWIYNYSKTVQLTRLLYNIGFFGIKNSSGFQFRSLGPSSSSPPPITSSTNIVIHPSYVDALDLRPSLISSLDTELSWPS